MDITSNGGRSNAIQSKNIGGEAATARSHKSLRSGRVLFDQYQTIEDVLSTADQETKYFLSEDIVM